MTSLRLPSDRPQERLVDDTFERAGFVHAVADAIHRAPRDGYTVAVTGPWGEGKTSVLNFVTERILARGDAQIVVFHPWWFSGGGELMQRFFTEMASQLREKSEAGERVARALLGFAWTLETVNDAVPLPLVRVGARMANRTAASVRRGELSSLDRKRALESVLRELSRPIVVVIDDIDRLQPTEINEVLRLVRAVGDLPNLTYLLAFDPGPVHAALGGDTPESETRGAQALEKIVQARFALPPSRQALVDRLLTDALTAAIASGADVLFSPEAWSLLQHVRVTELIRNGRDIARLSGALVTTLERVGAEVEAADIIALEILRLKEPAAFDALVEAAVALTGGTTTMFGQPDDAKIADAAAVTAIIERTSVGARPVVRAVIETLFPAAGQLLGRGGFTSGSSTSWRRAGRVADRAHLDTYLHRGLTASAPSRATLTRATAALGDPVRLGNLLTQEEDALREVLGRLSDHLNALELPDVVATMQTLLDRAWALRPVSRPYGPSSVSLSDVIHMFAVDVLRSRTVTERIRVIEEAVYPDLSAEADLVRVGGPDAQAGGLAMLPLPEWERLEDRLLDKVVAASAQTMRAERDAAHLVWRAEQRRPAAIEACLRQWVEDDAFLVRWLDLSTTTYLGEGVRHEIEWARLIAVFGIETLRRRLSATTLTPTTTKEDVALQQARAALAAHDAAPPTPPSPPTGRPTDQARPTP